MRRSTVGLWVAFFVLLWLSAAYGQSGPFWNGGPYGRSYGGGGAIPFSVSTAVGTCVDGGVMVDVNGVVRCGSDTTTDPDSMIVRSGACYELDGTCTAPDLLLAGGIDTKQYTGVTQANCAGDTLTVSVTDNTGTLNAYALVEGVDFDCLVDDATCAVAIAVVIDALSGVSSQSSANTVGVRPADTTIALSLATSDATCATASNGTDGSTGLPLSQKLVFDVNADGNNYLMSPTDNTLYAYIEGGIINRWTTAGFQMYSDKFFYLGTNSNYWWIHSSVGSALSFISTDCDGGGTDCTLLSANDGEARLYLRNSEFIENDTDGKIKLGGSGGANNEDLSLDFETTSNWVSISSSTGVSFTRFMNMALVADWGVRVDAAYRFWWNGRSDLRSPADGQLQLNNSALSLGAVLDFDDSADTLTIKDQAGTGLGNLSVTGASQRGHKVIDCDDDPYTVLTTDHFLTVETDTGTCTGNMDITLPAVACDPVSSQAPCRVIDILRIGTVQVDIGGDSGTETINGATPYSLTSSYQSATLLETQSGSTDWTVR